MRQKMEFTDEDFINYKQYLNVVTEQLNKFFEDQRNIYVVKRVVHYVVKKVVTHIQS